MRVIFLVIPLFLLAHITQGEWLTNSASADSFVRAAAPDSNYGAAGALSVSGAGAVNGAGVSNGSFDTFIRFNTAALVTHFDLRFGAGSWTVNSARLNVTEVGAPNNALFNRGIGAFEVRWIANDSWTEGTGNPNRPADDGISYHHRSTLMDPGTDVRLGTFVNAGQNTNLSFALTLPVPLVNDVISGADVGLFLSASDPSIGFTFNSRSFGDLAARPSLEISVLPIPRIAFIVLSEPDVILAGTNGLAKETYRVLSSPNMVLPLNQWTPLATHTPVTDGEFWITLTNAAVVNSHGTQFFILETE